MAREGQLTTPDLTKSADTGVAPPFLCSSSDQAMLYVCVCVCVFLLDRLSGMKSLGIFIAFADNCRGY